MPVRLNGSTSGYVELAAPAVAGTTSLELPTDSIKPGLVLVAAQSFSAVSSVSVNNCFTATYENYRIVTQFTAGNGNIGLRMRSSGTDNSSSQYLYQYFEANMSSSTTSNISGSGVATSFDVGSIVTGYFSASVLDLFGPANSAIPTSNTHQRVRLNSGTAGLGAFGSGMMTVSTAYDGFTLYPSSGTFSGSVRVYGYRNSL